MRSLAAFVGCVLVLSPCLGGCNSKSIVDECPTGGRTGTAPHCVLSAQCLATNTGVSLDCTGSDGNCVCSKDGVVGSSVPYQDAFCNEGDPTNFTTMEDSLEHANDACGWKI